MKKFLVLFLAIIMVVVTLSSCIGAEELLDFETNQGTSSNQDSSETANVFHNDWLDKTEDDKTSVAQTENAQINGIIISPSLDDFGDEDYEGETIYITNGTVIWDDTRYHVIETTITGLGAEISTSINSDYLNWESGYFTDIVFDVYPETDWDDSYTTWDDEIATNPSQTNQPSSIDGNGSFTAVIFAEPYHYEGLDS